MAKLNGRALTVFGLSLFSILAFSTPSPAFARDKLDRQSRAAMGLTPAQIADKAGVTGLGQLDPDIKISTQGFIQSDRGDRWFRAYINKATGKVDLQFFMETVVSGKAYRPHTLTYMGASGLVSAPVIRINTDVTCPSLCYYTEQTAVDISRADLEFAAQGAQAGQDITWDSKLFGDSRSDEILTFKTEVAGFLIAVDRQLARVKNSLP